MLLPKNGAGLVLGIGLNGSSTFAHMDVADVTIMEGGEVTSRLKFRNSGHLCKGQNIQILFYPEHQIDIDYIKELATELAEKQCVFIADTTRTDAYVEYTEVNQVFKSVYTLTCITGVSFQKFKKALKLAKEFK